MEREKGIEPSLPAWKAGVLPLNYSRVFPSMTENPKEMGREGFEPPKRNATDLQSVPVDHLGICPTYFFLSTHNSLTRDSSTDFALNIKAGERLRTPDLLITSQLLYQLSYASEIIQINFDGQSEGHNIPELPFTVKVEFGQSAGDLGV